MIGKYFALLVTFGVAAAVQPIPVTIYYESLCSDSMKFFTDQFTPVWKDLKEYMKPLTLVPYGKSNITLGGSSNFSCHHGPNECVGNKYQSCIIGSEYHFAEEDKINYIDCLMKEASKDHPYGETVKSCEKRVPGVSATKLDSCAQGQEGETLLFKNGKTTDQFQKPLMSAPTIVFNDINNPTQSKNAEKSFRSTFCGLITDNQKPKACDGNGAPITTVGLITLLIATLVARLL